MERYRYLIIGGGMTADSAVRGIRQADSDGEIGLISAESHPPYNRPPLSKDLWKEMKEERIWRHTEEQGVTLHLSRQATEIDPDEKRVTDNTGKEYRYERLLLATGGSPVTLDNAPEGIVYFRDYDDYRNLRNLTEHRDKFLVIGGGFIGSEIAAALSMNGKSVTMLFPEAGIGGRIFPEAMAQYLNGYYEEQGVRVHPNELVQEVSRDGKRFGIRTDSGNVFRGEEIIAGLGIRPNTALARQAGLRVDDGIVVDSRLHTSAEDIYAAGDVASFYNESLDRYLRVEHEENANIQGMLAGVNMAGGDREYNHLPFFYSDLFDHGYEAVGRTTSNLQIIEDWEDLHQKGVLYYVEDERVQGVVLWNVWGQVDNARKVLSEGTEIEKDSLKGRLPQ